MSFDRLLLIAIVFVLTIALTASELARMGQSSDTKALEKRLEVAAADAETALKAIIKPETLANAEPSVYMVVNNKTHHGSAFVLDREKGILVTAAHVASGLDLQDTEKSFSVLNRHSKKPLRIRAKEIHAGFPIFRRIIEDYQPIDPDSTIVSPRNKRLIDVADDAALLIVDPIDPETGENILGPALPLASEATLKAMTSGDPIAVIGYPVDTVTSNTEEDSAAARVERGVIATMLSPIDVVGQSGNPETQNLIVHRMAAAPGNSGGPIINRNGEIVGISSHGNDSGHSNGDSLAQRADVIHDMITPFREQDLMERVYIPDWRKRLANWPQAKEILPYIFYQRYSENDNFDQIKDITVGELEILETPPFRARSYTREFGANQRNFILQADDLEEQPESAATSKDKNSLRTTAAQKPVFLIDNAGEYASYKVRLNKDEHHAIFAFDYSMAWTSPGYCPLALYSREQGNKTMRSTKPQRMPSLLIKTSTDKKAPTNLDIIVRRGRCDSISKEYLFGIVSWKPEEKETAPQISFLPGDGQRILASFKGERQKVGNFLNCNVEPFQNDTLCEKAIKVQNFTTSSNNSK